MKMSIKISFNNSSDKCYLTNQTIEGTVEIAIDKDLKIRGKSSFVDRRKIEMSGIHNYNFQCVLPDTLPESVEGVNGYVRYYVEATLDVERGKTLKHKEDFSVIKFVDLNESTNYDLRSPAEINESRALRILGCFGKSGFVEVKMRVAKTGYAFGETIHVRVDLISKSKDDVKVTKLALKQVEQCYIPGNGDFFDPKLTAFYFKNIDSRVTAGLKSGDSVTIIEKFKIPEKMLVSNDHGYDQVFRIRYIICFKIYHNRFEIPITIGNVALDEDKLRSNTIYPEKWFGFVQTKHEAFEYLN
ncbi:Arrestin domain-containing protein 17 [Pseudolycoriella hygida]|uniref:Arrestin domain-containing protein 17 n=1 Tax=Pseudolycoriella hygida TaxID=35572 RepID=A0A9Q0NG80_9DIPT|nr:Arrestin domain-containing protein 17 [Pseudolycoriella hygida]